MLYVKLTNKRFIFKKFLLVYCKSVYINYTFRGYIIFLTCVINYVQNNLFNFRKLSVKNYFYLGFLFWWSFVIVIYLFKTFTFTLNDLTKPYEIYCTKSSRNFIFCCFHRNLNTTLYYKYYKRIVKVIKSTC